MRSTEERPHGPNLRRFGAFCGLFAATGSHQPPPPTWAIRGVSQAAMLKKLESLSVLEALRKLINFAHGHHARMGDTMSVFNNVLILAPLRRFYVAYIPHDTPRTKSPATALFRAVLGLFITCFQR